jgi:hypothetical protein
MRLPRTIRHWLLLRHADYQFTARTGWNNNEDLIVVRAGCLQKLIDDANSNVPSCGNEDCWQGRNAWHHANCDWYAERKAWLAQGAYRERQRIIELLESYFKPKEAKHIYPADYEQYLDLIEIIQGEQK